METGVVLFRFDRFELDTGLIELRAAGNRIALEPQVFDLLAYLVENHARVVPKDELIEHIWPEKYISEAALNSRVMAARKALGDSGQEQRLIRTIHSRGYRFVGAVTVDTREAPIVAPTPAPAPPEQTIRFCRARDGTRIAYSTAGSGLPLVKAANWLTHLEFDFSSPVWRHMWQQLATRFLLARYDARGSGLSDWDVPRFSFEAWVEDLEAVVDEIGLERFALFGLSQGGPVAIAYAARHPERVSHLVLLGAYARGRKRRSESWAQFHDAMKTLMLQGWGKEDASFREIFSITMIPDGTTEQLRWLTDLQRVSASPENAVRFHDTSGEIFVDALLPQIKAPTLVLHARNDQRVPFEEGRRIASLIPGARFVTLESRNHLLLEHEPAWARCLAEIVDFLHSPGGDEAAQAPD